MAMLEQAPSARPQNSTALTHTEILPIDNQTGYRGFQAGSFTFKRDEYFARISWPDAYSVSYT